MANALGRIIERLSEFSASNAGSAGVRNALMFAGVGVALAILGAPLMQSATERYAGNSYGIDRVMTGSIDKPVRYTVRRSVLSSEEVRLCGPAGRQC